MSMLRNIILILSGYACWTLIWLGGNWLLFPSAAEVVNSGEFLAENRALFGSLLLSVFCSLVSGGTVGKFAGSRKLRTAGILATLLLVTGIVVQVGVWDQMPIWYHLAFLALLMPMVVLGARFSNLRKSSS